MRIIAGGRQYGKTTEIVRQFLADPIGLLVVFNRSELKRIVDTFELSAVKAAHVYTWHDVLFTRGFQPKSRLDKYNIYIDMLDMVLAQLLSPNIRPKEIVASVDQYPGSVTILPVPPELRKTMMEMPQMEDEQFKREYLGMTPRNEEKSE